MRVEQESNLSVLASWISDGVPVDWKQIESGATDEELRRRQSSLKTVGIIAALHRNGSLGVESGDIRVWGRLEVRGKIGSGSFGNVYRAWDPDLRREVALKLVSSSGRQQAAAMKEARALARVRHANVVTVYGVDRQGGEVGLWMDLIRGRTLEAIVRDHGPLGGREAALVGLELCKALAAVHAERLVHGDLKAQNVMREEGGRIVLMDFGLVRNSADAGSEQGGTPAYMAPELAGGEGSSVASDIFALGVLLYYLVTGAFPSSRNTRDTGRYAANAKLLLDRRPDLPENFVQLIEQALSPEPEQRFATAGEMRAALTSALGSERAVAVLPDPRPSPFRLAGPVFALLVLLALTIWWGFGRPTAPASPMPPSIAVLPFENLSTGPDTEYLAEAVANDVTSRLTRLKGIRVVPVENALTSLKAHDDLLRIARKLRVGKLLVGSFRKSGDTIYVAVKLIDPEPNKYLWSENYEKSSESFRTLGSEIAHAVVPKLADMQLPESPGSPTVNNQAYNAYLKGHFHWNKRTNEGLRKAIGYFKDAIKADPDYALAYSGLADCYSTLVDYGYMPASEGLPEAKAAASKALQLNDSLPETNLSFAWVSEVADWDWSAAEARYLQALQLDSNNATAHSWYARFLIHIGHVDEAILEAERAAYLDPLSLAVNNALGADLYLGRHYNEARDQLAKTLELEPGFIPAHFWLGRVYIRQRKFGDALSESEKAGEADVEHRQLAELLAAETHAVAGSRTEALKVIENWQVQRSHSNVAASNFAVVYSSLHEKELTLEWLGRAYDEHDSSLLTARTHPAFDWIKADSGFKAVFARMGLPYKSNRQPGDPY